MLQPPPPPDKPPRNLTRRRNNIFGQLESIKTILFIIAVLLAIVIGLMLRSPFIGF